MPNVIVFGAGISGLTISHELLERGYSVQLYESTDVVGGFARSRRLPDKDDMPTEHSWRAYAPFYMNFFNIAKRIPTKNGKTVYDNLSRPYNMLLPHNEITERGMKPKPSLKDWATIGLPVAKCLMSDKRREVYAKQDFNKLMRGKLSPAGNDQYLEMLGTGLGLNPKKTSVLSVAKFAEMDMGPTEHYHHDKHGDNKHQPWERWHVMKKPTSEAWFEPWLTHLKNMGLKIYFNSELVRINTTPNKTRVINCLVSYGKQDKIVGTPNDIYVFCVNPFFFKDILVNSGLATSTPDFIKAVNVVKDGPHYQIGFRLAFNKKINVPQINDCFIFPDSEFNITLYPQDNFFDLDDPYFKNISGVNMDLNKEKRKSLWSGTICVAFEPGKLYGKPAYRLDKDKLIREVIFQVFRSKELHRLIESNNNYKMKDLHVVNSNVWYEWEYDKKTEVLRSITPKWVNSLNTHQYRPNQKSGIPNAYIGGSHTKTTVDIWSMEGAVESGKIIAKDITERTFTKSQQKWVAPLTTPLRKKEVYLFKHVSPWFLKPFQFIDDILYQLNLPNVLYFLLVIILIIVIASIKWVYEKSSKKNK